MYLKMNSESRRNKFNVKAAMQELQRNCEQRDFVQAFNEFYAHEERNKRTTHTKVAEKLILDDGIQDCLSSDKKVKFDFSKNTEVKERPKRIKSDKQLKGILKNELNEVTDADEITPLAIKAIIVSPNIKSIYN